MYLPVLFTMLFYLNIIAWHYARINYVLIFELDVRLFVLSFGKEIA